MAERNRRRQEGLLGSPASGIIPAAINEDAANHSGSNNSGNSSGGGAVSGTDSESEPETMGRMVKDLTAVEWTPKLEAQLEDILIRNAFEFKQASRDF